MLAAENIKYLKKVNKIKDKLINLKKGQWSVKCGYLSYV